MKFKLINKLPEEEEAKVSKDRYLITYADLITLLLGLFVILYAASQVDEVKYKEVSKALKDYFKSTKEQVLTGSGGTLEGHKKGIPEPIMPNPSNKSLSDIEQQTENSLGYYIKKGLLTLTASNNELVMGLPEALLFNSGMADIQPEGESVLDTIAEILKNVQFQITVDGHTDDVPIRTFRYESNWHLSVARAMNVAYLLIQRGVGENNLIVRGFGAERPVADNSKEQGRAKNRRVEITVSNTTTNVPSKEGYYVNGKQEK
jgi:chemotaxis protein MotB